LEDLLEARRLPYGGESSHFQLTLHELTGALEKAVLHAPVYEPQVLKEVKASYVTSLASFGPRQVKKSGKDKEGEQPTCGRKTGRDSQPSSGPRSQSRKAASDGSGDYLSPSVLSLRYSADAMDEDSEIELIPNPEAVEKQQRSGGGPQAWPALKSQGMSFRLILTLVPSLSILPEAGMSQ
jgi:hypothetical protein